MLQQDEFMQSFVEEAKSHIDTVEAELLGTGTDGEESINTIFRAVHSIKGTSSFFDLKNIVALSHALENIFGEIRSGSLSLTEDMVDVVLSANDCLKEMINDVGNSENVDISQLMEALAGIGPQGMSAMGPSEGQEVQKRTGIDLSALESLKPRQALIKSELDRGCRLYRLRRKIGSELLAGNRELLMLLREIKSFGSIINCAINADALVYREDSDGGEADVEIFFTTVLEQFLLPLSVSEPEEDLQELAMDLEETPEPVRQKAETQGNEGTGKTADMEKRQASPSEDSIRVSVTQLNNLLNMASEMVLARNQLLRTMEEYKKGIPGIEPILQNIDHKTSGLQEQIMQTRMQPISIVFNKFPRITRDIAKKLGKDIKLELEGNEVELDKSIIEALADPLTHLVRNAIDHGLEFPDDRTRLGKPRTGLVKLKAYHESGYVNIDIIDDGKGIDLENLRAKGIEKAFISMADAAAMSEQEILQLIFRPGFSTSEKVTDISGRGVGMDVVKTNIEKLGGKIEVFTALQAGTTFRLLLPLTLAIIPSLIVEAEGQKFVLPQINLDEIVRIKANDPQRRIELINDAEVLRLRGSLLPVVHLSDVLGIQRTYIEAATGKRKIEKRKRLFDIRRCVKKEPALDEAAAKSVAERRKYSLANIVRILIIKIGSRRLGVCVDNILGTEEILVKPLPVYVKECICYSGVTILGDGKTAMILDPSGIIEKANLRYLEGHNEQWTKQAEEPVQSIRESQDILLFKCSGPETLAVDMSLVSRVEEIKPEAIETIGGKEYMKYRGESLRIIRPEHYLPIDRLDNDTSLLYVIIPKLVKHPIGILVELVNDTIQTCINITQEDSIKAKGLVGSTILGDRIVLLVNIYELFEMASPEHYEVKEPIRQASSITLLLVEDTPFFQKIEKGYLENAGYRVLLAQNGREALEVLERERVDMVVSDVNMPEMNGLELVRRIRSDGRWTGLPVIALTSLTGEQQKREGLEAGFDAYEFKLDRARLLEIVAQMVQARRVDV